MNIENNQGFRKAISDKDAYSKQPRPNAAAQGRFERAVTFPPELDAHAQNLASQAASLVLAAHHQKEDHATNTSQLKQRYVRTPEPVTLNQGGSRLENTRIVVGGEGNDAINVKADGTQVKNVHVENYKRYGHLGGHGDILQDIPDDQYIGGVQRQGVIDGIFGKGSRAQDSVQGLVGTDGCFVDKSITRGVLDIGSPNKIAYNGFASGRIDGIKDGQGQDVVARLQPLRVCGNPGTGNTWILSVWPKEHECNPGTITGSNYSAAADKRRELPNPKMKQDRALCDFNLEDFQQEMKSLTINQALADPAVNRTVSDWLNGLKTTQQPEFKNTYSEMIEKYEKYVKKNKPINELGGKLGNVFCKAIAENYGRPCDKVSK